MTPELRLRIRYARTQGYHIFQRDGTDQFIVKRTWDDSGQHCNGAALLSMLPRLPIKHSPYSPEEFARRGVMVREMDH
jgi:hypothetical protein